MLNDQCIHMMYWSICTDFGIA